MKRAAAIAALVVAAQHAETAFADITIVVGERTPLVMLIVLPKEAASTTPTSEFLSVAAAVFHRRTGLELLSVEQAGFDGEKLARCEKGARLSCWVNEVRSVPLLFALTVLPFEKGRDRLSAVLIETARALRCDNALDRSADDSTAKMEDCIFESAAKSRPVVVDTNDRARLVAYFESLLSEDFGPRLEAMHAIDPFGRIALFGDEAEDEITLDGSAIGKTVAGVTHLADVAPGKRSLQVRARSGWPVDLEVEVLRGRTASVTAQLARGAVATRDPGRTIMLISGSGIAALGVVFGAVSIAKTASVETRCFVSASSPSASCAALGDPSFGFHGGALPTAQSDAVNPHGVPILAIGAALFTAGLTWAAAAFFGDPSDSVSPLEVGLGVGGGVLAFGAFALLDRR